MDTPTQSDIGMIAEYCAMQNNVIFNTDLASLGITPRQVAALVRRGDLRRVFRGAFTVDTGTEFHESYRRTVTAYVRTSGHAVRPLAGPAALVYRGLPIWGRAPDGLHVIGSKQGTRSIIRPLDPVRYDDLTESDGVPMTTVARSIIDTARLCSPEAAVAAGDAALRRGLVSIDEIEEVAERQHGFRGIVGARQCLSVFSKLSESPGESVSHLHIKLSGLPMPEQQHVFYDADGFVARSDFWWEYQRLVGEYDGRYKYARDNPANKPVAEIVEAEKFREDRLRALGPHVARWTTEHISRRGRLADIIWRGFRISAGHHRRIII